MASMMDARGYCLGTPWVMNIIQWRAGKGGAVSEVKIWCRYPKRREVQNREGRRFCEARNLEMQWEFEGEGDMGSQSKLVMVLAGTAFGNGTEKEKKLYHGWSGPSCLEDCLAPVGDER